MNIDYDKISDLLKALAHPVRLRMVEGLMANECNVDKIVNALSLPQSTVSQHLGILKNRGILKFRKIGVKTCYYLADKRIPKLLKILAE